MKKLLRKRSMLLVALLVSLCMPTVLRAAVIVEGETDGKVYYIRNVATGLYLKYGGAYGMDAVEGRAAHPIKLVSLALDHYQVGSLHGYLNSKYTDASLFLDRGANESNWHLKECAAGTGEYWMLGEGGRALASIGNQYGVLELKPFDPNTDFQKWEFVTESELRSEMSTATADAPVDVTALIKGSAFDRADLIAIGSGSLFYDEVLDLRDLEWNKKGIESAGIYQATDAPWVLVYDEDNDGVYDGPTGGFFSGYTYHDLRIREQKDYERVTLRTVIDTKPGKNEAGEAHWEVDPNPQNQWTLQDSYINYWAGFGRMQHYEWMDRWTDLNATSAVGNFNACGLSRNNIHNEYVVEQNLGKLPAGTYTFTYQGFYALRNSTSSVSGQKIGLTITGESGGATVTAVDTDLKNYVAGDFTHDFIAEGGNAKGHKVAEVFRANRENGLYRGVHEFTLAQETENVTIRIHKPSTSGSTGLSNYQWLIAFDDFTLVYFGGDCDKDDADVGKLYYEKVKAAYEEALEKVNALDDTGLTCSHSTSWQQTLKVTFDHNNKIAKLNSNNIDTEKDYLEALANIEAAYQAALAAHKQAIMDKTDDNDVVPDVPFILNHSFETGDLTGWTVGSTGAQIAVFPNANDIYKTEDTDGNYLFNSYVDDENTFTPWIKQEITGLKNGLYKLQALLTSFEGNHVYLIGNNYHDYIVADGKTTFKEATLYFLVENGTATIGAIGGHHRMHNRTHEPVNGKHLFDCYWPDGGCFFKADNFRLTYICDVPNGKLRLALNEASNAKLDEYGQERIANTITTHEGYYTKRSATADNVGNYVKAIHEALNTAAKAQKTIGADMTYAIKNPNFEWDWVDGEWVCATYRVDDNGNRIDDTGIKEQDHWNYKTAGADGRFLFNTWDGGTAKPLTQTAAGLPNGTYKVRAMVTSDAGDDMVILTANNCSTSVKTYAGSTGEYVEVECKVTGDNGVGNLDIKVEGKSVGETGCWFKADDFHLTLVLPSDELVLNQDYEELPEIDADYKSVTVKRPVTANDKWTTFAVPFPISEKYISEWGWDVRELVSSRADAPGADDKQNITLIFGKVKDIEAAKPYMVKVANSMDEFVVENVRVNTKESTSHTIEGSDAVSRIDDVEFIGVYTMRFMPVGVYFVNSNNQYKRVVKENNNLIRGYRAYIKLLDDSGVARSLGYRWGDETGIDSANNDEVTIVGIYNLNGMRLDDMQEGVNILRMSDGSTMKVIIK